MVCPHCGVSDCTEIVIHLNDEDATLQFFSCKVCETKWWERAGDTIALDEVLDLATRVRRKR